MSSLRVKRTPAEQFDSEDLYRYISIDNERKSFIINIYEDNGVKCVSLLKTQSRRLIFFNIFKVLSTLNSVR